MTRKRMGKWMLIRKCRKNHKVYIFKPRTTGEATLTFKFSDTETVVFNTQGKAFVVVCDGDVVKRTDTWITAQNAYTDECSKKHSNPMGLMMIGKHQLKNGIMEEL